MSSVYKKPYFKNGPITNDSIEMRYHVHSNPITTYMDGAEPYWTAPFQGKGNEPNVIYSKDLPKKFYSRKIYIYGNRLHDLSVDYDGELIVENVSDTTDQILYTVFLLKTSNVAPTAIDAMLPRTKHCDSKLDINEMLNSDGVETIVYEEPEKRSIVMILMKPIPIQTEFITRATKPETPLFTLFPKTYSIANVRVDNQEGFAVSSLELKNSGGEATSTLSEVKEIKMEASGLQMECTMNRGEDDVNVVTKIDTKYETGSATFFLVAATFFLIIGTIIITPYMYFSMRCFAEKPESSFNKLTTNMEFNNWKQPLKVICWTAMAIVNFPFFVLIFLKWPAATWGNFIISLIVYAMAAGFLLDGTINKKPEETIAGSMLIAFLVTAMFAINHYSSVMNKPAGTT